MWINRPDRCSRIVGNTAAAAYGGGVYLAPPAVTTVSTPQVTFIASEIAENVAALATRGELGERLGELDGVDADEVIFSPDGALVILGDDRADEFGFDRDRLFDRLWVSVAGAPDLARVIPAERAEDALVIGEVEDASDVEQYGLGCGHRPKVAGEISRRSVFYPWYR